MNNNLKKNYILFLVLSTLVIFGYSYFFYEPEENTEKSRQTATDNTAKTEPAEKINEPDIQENTIENEVVELERSFSEQIITVENDRFIAKLDTLGGKIVELELKEYYETTSVKSPNVKIIDNKSKSFYTVLKLQNIDVPLQIPYSYSGNTDVKVDTDSHVINLTWRDSSGITVNKSITFYKSKYFIEENISIVNNTGSRVTENTYISWSNNVKESSNTKENYKLVSLVAGDVDRVDSPPDEPETYSGEIKWFGFSGKYFISAFLPQIGGSLNLDVKAVDDKGTVGSTFTYPSESISPGSSSERKWRVYLGPKNKSDLMTAGYNLEESIDYGYAGVLTKIAVGVLKFANKYIQNYGVSIIVTTLFLRLIFLPLTVKSMRSMKEMQVKMQAIKPKIDELKEKYKDDKQTQQTEMMKLYTSHGVNPLSSLGGCLPLLLQFPVFIALYFALLYSIDLRHTPFLWIADLSEPEHLFDIAGIPFRILPLLMGVSWFFSQRLTPTTTPGSETMELQMKMMQFMPIIFTVMFWGLPSGLILYWTVSNIISIGQQLYINRHTTTAVQGGN